MVITQSEMLIFSVLPSSREVAMLRTDLATILLAGHLLTTEGNNTLA